MIFKKYILVLLFLFIFFPIYAQIGGRNAYSFMYVPNNAFTASLGGINVTSGQTDSQNWTQNPALLNQKNIKLASFSYNRWQADIAQYSVGYSSEIKKLNGIIGANLQYINYGKMELTDPTGTSSGSFSVSDFCLSTAYSRKQDNFRFGGQLKLLGSQIETYRAYALVADIGATFIHPKNDFVVGLVLKNLGFRLQNYVSNHKSPLPFDAQLGLSFKPKYMPVRFSTVFHHLHNWNITYFDPNLNVQLDLNGQATTQNKSFFDELARHFVFGAEILLHKNFQINVGYNHLINRELRIKGLGGARGFTAGFRLKIKDFEFGYAYNGFQAGGGARNFITLAVNTAFFKKKKEVE
ncbi:MAG: hypothetical protein EAZ85_03990 [Bacteroidetes bacterium]|nr:MAG: hypothetical protein EAZ85_03990 [Bacteroidota bacterium]TAG90705.1 MAG: hypothetical protein EAZ20_03725 [Bacteroidota bacterium]